MVENSRPHLKFLSKRVSSLRRLDTFERVIMLVRWRDLTHRLNSLRTFTILTQSLLAIVLCLSRKNIVLIQTLLVLFLVEWNINTLAAPIVAFSQISLLDIPTFLVNGHFGRTYLRISWRFFVPTATSPADKVSDQLICLRIFQGLFFLVIWVESGVKCLLILIGFLSFIKDELTHIIKIAILDIMKVIFAKKKWTPL